MTCLRERLLGCRLKAEMNGGVEKGWIGRNKIRLVLDRYKDRQTERLMESVELLTDLYWADDLQDHNTLP